MSPWSSVQNLGRGPLGGALYSEGFYISTSVAQIIMKFGTIMANAILTIVDEGCYQGTL